MTRRQPPVRSRHGLRALTVLLAVAALAAACGDDDEGSGGSRTLAVPADYETISDAVAAAEPGDLVLVSPGVYTETVTVEVEDLVIRGTDRNEVIIDGEFERENGIIVFSDGVAVENLTARNHVANGVFFTGDYGKGVTLEGYRASYVTAHNNGLYGVYAFNATKGVFEHSYGSGHPDSAFYVGQCNPCDAVLTDLVAERNMLGYSGTNSTGVTIVDSVWRENRSGMVPSSLFSEALYPNSGTAIVGNLVVDNNSTEAPDSESFGFAYGTGIVLAGASNIVVERNLVRGHVLAGIAITDLPASENPDTGEDETFVPEDNVVRDNVVSENTYDLGYVTVEQASRLFGNCFEGNEPTTTFPEGLEDLAPCDGAGDPDLGDLSGVLAAFPTAPPDVDWKTVPAPPDQPQMPDAETAPARPARPDLLDLDVDLAAVEIPRDD